MERVASGQMADQRAILTDTEREILSGEKDVKDNYRYSVESRVRSRLRDVLPEDVEALKQHEEEHDSDLFEILHEGVCEGEDGD